MIKIPFWDLAKRFNWTSELGALLDPLADKLLLVCAFVTLGYLGWIPYWLVALVILRDLVIVAGAVGYHYYIEQLIAAPSPDPRPAPRQTSEWGEVARQGP